MIIHIALFKWKGDIPKEEISRLISNVKNLKGAIPEIVDIYAGENYSKWAKGYTHAIVATFKTSEDLDKYREHPIHKPIMDLCDKFEKESIGVDFES